MKPPFRFIHLNKQDLAKLGEKVTDSLFLQSCLSFKTCLRQIWFLPVECQLNTQLEKDGIQIHEGTAALQLITEIMCGLHSPLVGETEVMGQFKEFLSLEKLGTAEFQGLADHLKQAYEIAKKVRANLLTDLGAQSYGSFLRKSLAQSTADVEVAMIGNGHLANELLPWIMKKNKIHLFQRNMKSLNQQSNQQLNIQSMENVMTRGLGENPRGQVLVLAAPIPNSELEKWASQHHFQSVFDFRGEQDPGTINTSNYVTLKQVFDELQQNSSLIQDRVSQAKFMIQSDLEEREKSLLNSSKIRPFGWDDICA